MVGCLGIAPSSRRLRAGTSRSKFATLVAVCKDRDTKAELNRRSQACESPGRHRYSRREKWTGMRVARPLFRFGRPTCVYQHLCPKKWNPMLESHQPLRFCKPPPELLGQRDVKLMCGRKRSPPPAYLPPPWLLCTVRSCGQNRLLAGRQTTVNNFQLPPPGIVTSFDCATNSSHPNTGIEMFEPGLGLLH